MPREISDEEYAWLQGRRQVADFVESIYNDPNLSKEAKRLIKKKYPTLAIPDLDIQDDVDRRFEEEKKAREDAELATRQKQTNEHIASERARVQKEFGFTEDGMKELEDMMINKNIGDYEAAAAYHASKNPKTAEPTYDNFRWNHDRQEGFKEIAADPEGWARKELLTAIRADERMRKGQG